MKTTYTNSPIVEAACEFRLPGDSALDPRVPDLIYQRIKTDFPIRERRSFQELELFGPSKSPEPRIIRGEHALFFSEGKKAFVKVGSNLVSVNCLNPYPSWEVFRSSINLGFDALVDMVGVNKLRGVNLRYTNRVSIPGEAVVLDDYFEFRLYLGPNLPQSTVDFIAGCELPFCGARDICRIQLTPVAGEDGDVQAFMLDLQYYFAQPAAIQVSRVLGWIDEAHQNLCQVFEACISERLRSILQEVKTG